MIQKRKKYALAVDRGTTNACAVLFDARGKIVATAQKEFARIYPQPGWVEHNPSDIIETVCDCIRNVAANGRVDARDIKAIGITETTHEKRQRVYTNGVRKLGREKR